MKLEHNGFSYVYYWNDPERVLEAAFLCLQQERVEAAHRIIYDYFSKREILDNLKNILAHYDAHLNKGEK